MKLSPSTKSLLTGALVVPVGLFLILVPYSLVIGWNLATGLLFWVVITPALAIFLPTRFSRNESHLWESLVGLILFYMFMVFMIYKHYESDFFKVMMAGAVINIVSVIGISLAKRGTVALPKD